MELEHRMNIFEALRESHVIQRNLAERLLQTSGDTPERRELFECLKNDPPCFGRTP